MSLLKEFLSTRTKLNCMWFAIPISILFTFRYTYTRQLPFFSAGAAIIYCVFIIFTYLFLMIGFFTLFALGKRKG